MKDQKERDEFAKRLLQKDKDKTIKKHNLSKNQQGITLTADEKMEVMPDLRNQSRMNFLGKREQEKINLAKKKLEDDKNIFPDYMLTDKQIKLREIDERIISIAQGNYVPNSSTPGYQPPEKYEDDSGRIHKDKKMKALYGKYEEVGTATTDAKLWEQSQDNKAKNAYRTID